MGSKIPKSYIKTGVPKRQSDWLSLFVMLLAVNLSGNPYLEIFAARRGILMLVAIIFVILLFIQKKIEPPRSSVSIFVFFIVLFIFQATMLDYYPMITYAGFFIKLFIGYASVRLIRNFSRTYVDTMVILGLLSLCFYIPHQLDRLMGFDFPALFKVMALDFGELGPWKKSIGVHTFMLLDLVGPGRNAGIFWEPGAFAGFLSLGLVFLGSLKEGYNKRAYLSRCVVLFVCLATTFSTMGYILLPLAMLLHFNKMTRYIQSKALRMLIVPLLLPLIVGAGYFSWKQDFISEKLLSQYYQSFYYGERWEGNRFGNMIVDWEYIRSRPLLGWGMHENTRLSLSPYTSFLDATLETRGNGMTDFIAKNGILAFALWSYLVYRYILLLADQKRRVALVGLVIILLALNGQCFLNAPFFLGLIFLYSEYRYDSIA